MAETIADTRRLISKPQNLNDAYGPPSNFLEIDVGNPQTVGVGRGRFTTYEIRVKVRAGPGSVGSAGAGPAPPHRGAGPAAPAQACGRGSSTGCVPAVGPGASGANTGLEKGNVCRCWGPAPSSVSGRGVPGAGAGRGGGDRPLPCPSGPVFEVVW